MHKCLFYTFNFKISEIVLTSINSFISNNFDYDIKLFAINFTDLEKQVFIKNLEKINFNCDVIFKNVENYKDIPGMYKNIQGLLNEKFKILYDLKKEYDLVIYSDPDVIFRKSVKPIENYVSENPGMYATIEERNFSSYYIYVQIVKSKLKLKNYYNCGFIVLNSKIPKFSDEVFDKVDNILRQFNDCSEQNYMNYFYNLKPLKNEHNYIWVNKFCSDSISVHFANIFKPWKNNSNDKNLDLKNFELKIKYYFKDYYKYKVKFEHTF